MFSAKCWLYPSIENTEGEPTMIKSNLKELLDGQKMSIRELAIRIDYRYESVRKLYNNVSIQVQLDMIERICLGLNCEVGDLFTIVKDSSDERELNVN